MKVSDITSPVQERKRERECVDGMRIRDRERGEVRKKRQQVNGCECRCSCLPPARGFLGLSLFKPYSVREISRSTRQDPSRPRQVVGWAGWGGSGKSQPISEMAGDSDARGAQTTERLPKIVLKLEARQLGPPTRLVWSIGATTLDTSVFVVDAASRMVYSIDATTSDQRRIREHPYN